MKKFTELKPIEKAIILTLYIRKSKNLTSSRKNLEKLGIHEQSIRRVMPELRRKGFVEEIRDKSGSEIELLVSIKEIIE